MTARVHRGRGVGAQAIRYQAGSEKALWARGGGRVGVKGKDSYGRGRLGDDCALGLQCLCIGSSVGMQGIAGHMKRQ